MTALEEQLRDGIQHFSVRPIPAGRDPDVYVFGVMYPLGEATGQGWAYPACTVHLVGWKGPEPCWCCAAGIAPLKNYY